MSKFRFQFQSGLFTYKTHINKEALKNFFNTISKAKVEMIEVAHEEPDKENGETPYQHTHIVCLWEKNINITNERAFDFEDIHPHIKGINRKNKTQFKNCIRYLGKEDPENEHLLEWDFEGCEQNIVSGIQQCETLNEAYEIYGDKRSAIDIKMFYEARNEELKLLPPLDTEKIFVWQHNLLNEIKTKPKDRAIIWYYDESGGCGKSSLCKHIIDNKLGLVLRVGGGSREISNIIATALDQKLWKNNVFIFDITKQCEEHNFYQPLEEIKDGFMTSTKYEGKQLRFNTPHLFVMANFKPKLDKLADCRFIVRNLNKDKHRIDLKTGLKVPLKITSIEDDDWDKRPEEIPIVIEEKLDNICIVNNPVNTPVNDPVNQRKIFDIRKPKAKN